MWKLMSDNAITQEDREVMSDFIRSSPKLTQGEMVKKFEDAWSKWQGCKYSVFVNSGSSANLLAVAAMREKYEVGPWYAQSCTWATNVAPIIQLNGAVSGLCDTDLSNFGPDLKTMERLFQHNDPQKPKFYFLTHLLGFNALSDELFAMCDKYNVHLLEDCCESHGASFRGTKVGNFGECSTFSFYYGHHMTTIEGGVVCTNDKETYELLILLRSHGMLRELPKESRDSKVIDGLDPRFTFLCCGFNVRNMEMNALLGVRQLERLDTNNKLRNDNYKTFVEHLDPSKYHTNFKTDGMSSFCLPIFAKTVDIDRVKMALEATGIESRPCVGGNLCNHPMMQRNNGICFVTNSDILAKNCVYVGNHQDVTDSDIVTLCNVLNEVK